MELLARDPALIHLEEDGFGRELRKSRQQILALDLDPRLCAPLDAFGHALHVLDQRLCTVSEPVVLELSEKLFEVPLHPARQLEKARSLRATRFAAQLLGIGTARELGQATGVLHRRDLDRRGELLAQHMGVVQGSQDVLELLAAPDDQPRVGHLWTHRLHQVTQPLARDSRAMAAHPLLGRGEPAQRSCEITDLDAGLLAEDVGESDRVLGPSEVGLHALEALPQPRPQFFEVLAQGSAHVGHRVAVTLFEPLDQPIAAAPVLRTQGAALLCEPGQADLRIPSRSGLLLQLAQHAPVLSGRGARELGLPHPQDTPQPADRDPEVVQGLPVLGVVQPFGAGPGLVQELQGDAPHGLLGRALQQILREGHGEILCRSAAEARPDIRESVGGLPRV